MNAYHTNQRFTQFKREINGKLITVSELVSKAHCVFSQIIWFKEQKLDIVYLLIFEIFLYCQMMFAYSFPIFFS